MKYVSTKTKLFFHDQRYIKQKFLCLISPRNAMVFLFKIDRLANRSVFYPRSNSLIAHVIYMGENPPNPLSCHISSLTRQTSYIWSEDAKGRYGWGREKLKLSPSPSHPLPDFSLSVKDTAREMSARGKVKSSNPR